MLANKSHTIDEGAIIHQVEKICKSEELAPKKLLCDFLSYIVSEYLAGRAEHIKGYSIAIDVFGREFDFDPGQDALVRIHAGRLRRMLELYYLKSGVGDQIRIEMPVGGYIPVFSDNGEGNALDITEPSESEMDRENLFIEPSIAILPFKNLTGDPGKDFFSLGFSEELSVELTKYEDLIVYDFIYGSDSPVSEYEYVEFINKKRARFIIEGATNQIGDKLKLLVKLSDVLSGKQIWADSYTEYLTALNIIDIQERIAREVSGIVGGEYGLIPKRLSADAKRVKPQQLDTYSAMLKFYYFQVNQTPDSALQAISALEEAVKSEKESGIAMSMLAAMHCNMYMLDSPKAENSYLKMIDLAEKGCKLDPDNLMVKVIRASIHFACDEKEHFFRIADECLKRKPTISLRLGALGFHYMLYGAWDQGKEIMDQLMVSRVGYPLYFHGATTLYYYRLGKYDRALIECDRYDVPALFWPPMFRIAILGQIGRKEHAKQSIERLYHLKPDFSEKAPFLISRFVKEEDLVDHVIQGLHKAGLEISLD